VAVRESIALIRANPEAELVGIAQLVDRQERGKAGEKSTVMEVEAEFGVPVEAVLRMEDIMAYMRAQGMTEELSKMEKYREDYGARA
jgi:orotate phosphoribosyltransferase